MTSPLTHDDPERLGSYRLVARLGSGGMGTVYVARSDRGRTVALKTMHAEFAAQSDYLTRFRLEIDAARVIGSRHGAEVVDADPLAETPWLATEYVLGPPLDDLVALCGPLPEEATRAVGAALCDALAQLHNSEVVHRDLKPSNILITATGPKLIDFGIARAAGDDRLTRTGAAAGTPAFMSPEQATGMEHTAAGDVFALAGVLVFASTGHAPFGGGQAADLLYRVRYSDADLSGLPPGLRPVLERCFAKEAAQRPGTAELAEALRTGSAAFEESLPDVAHAEILRRAAAAWGIEASRQLPPEPEIETRTGDDGPAPGPLSRRRALLMAGSGVVLAGAGAGGAWAWLAPDDSDEEADDGEGNTDSRPAGAAPEALWTDRSLESSVDVPRSVIVGDHVVLVSDAGLTTLDVKSGKQQGKNESVVAATDLAVSDDSRMYAVDGESQELCPVNLDTATFRGSILNLSKQDLKSVSLVGAQHDLVLLSGDEKERKKKGKKKRKKPRTIRFAVDAATGKEKWRRVVKTGDSGEGAVIPVGSVLVLLAEKALHAVDLGTGREMWTRELPLAGRRATTVYGDYARTGSHIYLGLGLKEIIAVRVSDGSVTWRFGAGRKFPEKYAEDELRYGAPAVRNGVLYARELGNGIIALDARTGKLRWELKEDWAALPPGLSPPVVGKKYLYVPSEKTEWVTAVDLRSRKKAWSFRGPNDDGDAVLLPHRDSRRLIVTSRGITLALPLE